MATFCCGRLGWAAPEYSSPITTMGISSSGAASSRSWTCGSSLKKATMMLVSSSRLPFIEVHPLAPLLDGLDHLAGGLRVQDAGKSPEVLARYALGSPRRK